MNYVWAKKGSLKLGDRNFVKCEPGDEIPQEVIEVINKEVFADMIRTGRVKDISGEIAEKHERLAKAVSAAKRAKPEKQK